MTELLASLRRKIFGETWTIPLGVSAALVLEILARAVLPHGEWQLVGGFVLAALLIGTLLRSLPTDPGRASTQRAAAQPDQPTTTRTDR